jgi:hypothetical protein
MQQQFSELTADLQQKQVIDSACAGQQRLLKQTNS